MFIFYTQCRVTYRTLISKGYMTIFNIQIWKNREFVYPLLHKVKIGFLIKLWTLFYCSCDIIPDAFGVLQFDQFEKYQISGI